jgi:hypothetical protein
MREGFIWEIIDRAKSLNFKNSLISEKIEMNSNGFFKHMNDLQPFVFNFNKVTEDPFFTLKNHLSKLPIKVRTGDYSSPKNYAFNREYKDVLLGDYVNTLDLNQSYGYAGNVKFPWECFERLVPAETLLQESYEAPSLWLGPDKSITPLHVDGLDNISFQLSGKKKWILISPKFYDALEMSAPFAETPNLHVSSLDLRNGFEELTNRNLTFEVVDIVPGEGLYLPAGWAHFVVTQGNSAMVNLWASKKTCVPRILERK